jgi:hypothetical protein
MILLTGPWAHMGVLGHAIVKTKIKHGYLAVLQFLLLCAFPFKKWIALVKVTNT